MLWGCGDLDNDRHKKESPNRNKKNLLIQIITLAKEDAKYSRDIPLMINIIIIKTNNNDENKIYLYELYCQLPKYHFIYRLSLISVDPL